MIVLLTWLFFLRNDVLKFHHPWMCNCLRRCIVSPLTDARWPKAISIEHVCLILFVVTCREKNNLESLTWREEKNLEALKFIVGIDVMIDFIGLCIVSLLVQKQLYSLLLYCSFVDDKDWLGWFFILTVCRYLFCSFIFDSSTLFCSFSLDSNSISGSMEDGNSPTPSSCNCLRRCRVLLVTNAG